MCELRLYEVAASHKGKLMEKRKSLGTLRDGSMCTDFEVKGIIFDVFMSIFTKNANLGLFNDFQALNQLCNSPKSALTT